MLGTVTASLRGQGWGGSVLWRIFVLLAASLAGPVWGHWLGAPFSSDVTPFAASKEFRPELKLSLGRGAGTGSEPSKVSPATTVFSLGAFLRAYNSPDTSVTSSFLTSMGSSYVKAGDDALERTKPTVTMTTTTGPFTSTFTLVSTEPTKEEKDKAFKEATNSYYWGRLLQLAGGQGDPTVGTNANPVPFSGNMAKNLALAKAHDVGEVVGGADGATAVRLENGKAVRLPTGETLMSGRGTGHTLAVNEWHSTKDPKTGQPRMLADTTADGTKYTYKFRTNPETGEREFRYEKAADDQSVARARESVKAFEEAKVLDPSPNTKAALARLKEGALSETDLGAVDAALAAEKRRSDAMAALKAMEEWTRSSGGDTTAITDAMKTLTTKPDEKSSLDQAKRLTAMND